MFENPPTQSDNQSERQSLSDLLRYIPSGDTIPEESWRARHRNILIVLFAHIPFLLALGLYEGTESTVTGATVPEIPVGRVVVQLGILAGIGLLASWPALGRRSRTALASVGIVVASTTLVFFSGGFIEAHFHFFVAIVVLALYEDWLPFVLGIGVVGVSHTVFGLIEPSRVYNHAAAMENPFVWGLIHAVFVAAGAIALTAQWYSTERSREQVAEQLEEVERKRNEIDDLEAKKAELQRAKTDAQEAKATATRKQEELQQLNDSLESKADAYSEAMARAADGDLTVRLDPEAESEAMAKVGTSFNQMIGEIESAMTDIQSFATAVTTASTEADTSVVEVQQVSADVSDSVQQIAAGSDEQNELFETVSDEMTDLSAAIEEVAASAETVAQTAGETATVAEASEQTAQQAIDDVRNVQTALDSTVDNIHRLDEKMDDIGEIVGLISDIAEQTNMLALNANIEAARAEGGGGSGSVEGFAVVADEVKQLAEETRRAAGEVEQLIEDTQAQTTATVTKAQAASEDMENGVEAVSDVVETFDTVRENADESDAGIREISDATDDQAASAEEVASMIAKVSDISTDIAERTVSVSAAAEEQTSSLSDISGNVTDLSQRAKRLQTLLSEFSVSASPANP